MSGVFIKRITKEDKKYITNASTVTTKRFGPSGSLIKKNTKRERRREEIPKIDNEIFLGFKYIIYK